MTYRGSEPELREIAAAHEESAAPLRSDAVDVGAFAASMPADYRATFDHGAVAAHAAVVAARAGRSAHAALWRELPKMVGLCVVADDDLGLLSRISAALVACDVDVVSANAYTRTRGDGASEAVALVWIRRRPDSGVGPIRRRDVAAIVETVEAVVAGRASLDRAPASRAQPAPPAAARVQFDAERDGVTVLTVEAVDRPGLLLAVTRSVFAAGLQITGLRATTEQGRAIDQLHIAELDGAPLGEARKASLEAAILAAIDCDGDELERSRA